VIVRGRSKGTRRMTHLKTISLIFRGRDLLRLDEIKRSFNKVSVFEEQRSLQCDYYESLKTTARSVYGTAPAQVLDSMLSSSRGATLEKRVLVILPFFLFCHR
jgi:hypothetical protein